VQSLCRAIASKIQWLTKPYGIARLFSDASWCSETDKAESEKVTAVHEPWGPQLPRIYLVAMSG